MSSVPAPDERTIYPSHRQDGVDDVAFPVLREAALDMLRSVGELLNPERHELLWETGGRRSRCYRRHCAGRWHRRLGLHELVDSSIVDY